VRSPVEKGDYLLTTEREGIYESRIVHLEGGRTMLDVPILEKHLPVFYVALTSFTKREAPPASIDDPDLGRPRSLFGIVGLVDALEDSDDVQDVFTNADIPDEVLAQLEE